MHRVKVKSDYLGLTQEPFLEKDFVVAESSSDQEDHFLVDRH